MGGDKKIKKMLRIYNEIDNADEILELALKQAKMWKKTV